jgi:hypothetical protein
MQLGRVLDQIRNVRFIKIDDDEAFDILGSESNKTTVAAGGTEVSGAIDVRHYTKIGIHARATYGAAIAADPTVMILSSINASDFTTTDVDCALATKEIPGVADSDREIPITVEVSAYKQIKVAVKNNDGANPISVWVYGIRSRT